MSKHPDVVVVGGGIVGLSCAYFLARDGLSVAVLDRRYVIDDRGDRDGGQINVEPVSSEPARLIDTGVDEQPMQPGIEPLRIAQRGQITPGPDERVLHGVLGLFDVPEHEPGGAIQPGDRGACQLGEGVMIALPRSLHEVSLHHAPRRWHDRTAVLDEYGEVTPRNRSFWWGGAASSSAEVRSATMRG